MQQTQIAELAAALNPMGFSLHYLDGRQILVGQEPQLPINHHDGTIEIPAQRLTLRQTQQYALDLYRFAFAAEMAGEELF
ncbi:MAG: hypothetical protein JSR48_10500 [Verrucomicrobia bacterium]|nr:hypothetical protein [Verrucomicrobiota bacterium]